MTTTSLRQLALIKYVFQQGVAQSQQPSPLFVLALLNFQDAAELFLHLACEHHGIKAPAQTQFLQYWPLLAAKGPVAHEPGMDRLNRARVAFKHHANLPNEHDMEFFRVTTQSFFDDNSPVLFGTAFADVSLVELVTCQVARDYLKDAEANWAGGKPEHARDSVALAMSSLLRDYGSRKKDKWARDPFAFGPSIPAAASFTRSDPDREKRELSKFIEATAEAVEALQEALRLVAFGIDYRKFARFRTLTPTVTWMMAGNAVVNRGIRHPAAPPKADFDFCFGFVIECAVKLQQFDYSV